MIIYRFRITTDEQEDFLREVEIQPGQTFLDFHEILLSCADLEPCKKAFFYLTDLKFIKREEISLKPTKKQLRKYDKELDEIVVETSHTRMMKDAQLKKYIEDPHQKMIYEYYGKDIFVFYLELFKIHKIEGNFNFPRCVKATGELTKKVDLPLVPVTAPPEEEPTIKPFPYTATNSLFEGIQEDESELAEIEGSLDRILTQEGQTEKPVGSPATTPEFDEEEVNLEEHEHMESLEDYEDLENLEIRHRNFDGESDE